MQRRIRVRELKAQAAKTMVEAQQLMAHADRTLSIADRAVLQLQEKAMQLLVLGLEAVEEIMDGTNLELVVYGKTMPVQVRIKPREESDHVEGSA